MLQTIVSDNDLYRMFGKQCLNGVAAHRETATGAPVRWKINTGSSPASAVVVSAVSNSG
jgi:hypothetical protein